MTDRTMTDALEGSFLDRLNSEYSHVKDHHVSRLLATAGDLGDPRFLDAALQFGAREMAQVLFQLAFAPADAIADRARAAGLYLRGAERGWWKVSASDAERARALNAALYGNVEAQMKPKSKADLAREAGLPTEDTIFVKPKAARGPNSRKVKREETRRWIAVMSACSTMTATLTDRDATPGAKLDAIDQWFKTVGWLAPDELRKAMEKTRDRA